MAFQRAPGAVHPSGDGGAGPSAASSLLADATASPSSRFLASDPAALVTPSHTLFQQTARVQAWGSAMRLSVANPQKLRAV
ncbi:MAG: hypothetical protein ACRD1P_03280, partial [Thermoanaerobaculia bacterium]